MSWERRRSLEWPSFGICNTYCSVCMSRNTPLQIQDIETMVNTHNLFDKSTIVMILKNTRNVLLNTVWWQFSHPFFQAFFYQEKFDQDSNIENNNYCNATFNTVQTYAVKWLHITVEPPIVVIKDTIEITSLQRQFSRSQMSTFS